jgi:anti-sigma B factor antagonist
VADSFDVALVDGLAVVTTPDEIDIGNSALLREALAAAADTGAPVLIVDMARTEYCDSTGLNVLVRAMRQAGEEGRTIRLVAGGSGLQRIFAVTGVGSLFRVYESLDKALTATT